MVGDSAIGETAIGESGYSRRRRVNPAAGPDILLQTILDLGPNVPDGQIVSAVALPWLQIADEIERNPGFLFRFPAYPRKFEEFLAGAYERAGYHVVLTPPSADGGRDVIATKDGFGAIRILDQAKAYSPGRLVTHDDLRAMLGVLLADQNASKGVVTTTSMFQPTIRTSEQFAPFIPYRLGLKDGNDLRSWIEGLRKKK